MALNDRNGSQAGFSIASDPDKGFEARKAQSSMALDRCLDSGNAPRGLLLMIEFLLDRTAGGGPVDVAGIRQDVERIRLSCVSAASPDPGIDQLLLKLKDDTLTWLEVIQPLLVCFVQISLDRNVHRTHRKHLVALVRRIAEVASASVIRSESLAEVLRSVVTEFAGRGCWRFVVDFSQVFRDWCSEWIPLILHDFLKGIIHLEEYHLAPSIHSLPSSTPPLSRSTYELLLKAHLARRELSLASEVIHSMQQYSLYPSRTAYQAILDGYRLAAPGGHIYNTVFADLEHLGLKDATAAFNGLIDVVIAQGDLTSAYDIFDIFDRPMLDESGMKLVKSPSPTEILPSIRPPNAVPASTSTLVRMSSDDCQAVTIPSPKLPLLPNGETFSLFVQGYSSIGEFDRALDFFVEMVDLGFKPNRLVSRALLDAYKNAGQPEGVLNIVRQVEGWEEGPPADSWRQEESASGRTGLEQSRRLSTSMLEEGGLRGLRGLLENLTKQGVSFKLRSISLILSYLAKSSVVDAIRLSEIAQKLHKDLGTAFTISDLNILLHSFGAREAADPSVRQRRFRKDPTLANLSPSYKGDMRLLKHFLAMVQQLQSKGVDPDAYTCAILMQRFANNGGSPRTLWAYFRWQILDRGIKPAPHHISALLTAYVNTNDPYGARRAMDRGEALGVAPNAHHYTILISDFLKREKKDLAEALFLQMQERGIEPDLYICTVLANWAAKHGLIEQVRSLIERVRKTMSNVKQPNIVLETALFCAHNVRREYWLGQHDLEKALAAGMMPDKMLMRLNSRLVQDLRRNLRKNVQDAADLKRLEECIPFAQANGHRMRETVQKARGLEKEVVSKHEVDLTVESILENRRQVKKKL